MTRVAISGGTRPCDVNLTVVCQFRSLSGLIFGGDRRVRVRVGCVR